MKYFLSEDLSVLVRVAERFSDLMLFRNLKDLQRGSKETFLKFDTHLLSVYTDETSNYVWTFVSSVGTYKIVSDSQGRCYNVCH